MGRQLQNWRRRKIAELKKRSEKYLDEKIKYYCEMARKALLACDLTAANVWIDYAKIHARAKKEKLKRAK